VYHVGMTSKLAELNQELNTALLKVIEKDSAIGRLSEQLESKSRTLALSPSSLWVRRNSSSCSLCRDQSRTRPVPDGSGIGLSRTERGSEHLPRVGGGPQGEH
jgi:hypothetical protein